MLKYLNKIMISLQKMLLKLVPNLNLITSLSFKIRGGAGGIIYRFKIYVEIDIVIVLEYFLFSMGSSMKVKMFQKFQK